MALQITDATHEEVLQTDKLVIIDFWAEWCGPCKMVGPIIDEISDDYKRERNLLLFHQRRRSR